MSIRDVIAAREAVAIQWCREHGKDFPPQDMKDILAIRALPEWKNAADALTGEGK